MPTYDAIVIGTGGVGSAGAVIIWRPAGRAVLGLDRFPPGHDHGSSHGQTRIIRLAYFEHPDYVPLSAGGRTNCGTSWASVAAGRYIMKSACSRSGRQKGRCQRRAAIRDGSMAWRSKN